MILLGIAGAAGLYAVMDQTLLSKATAGVADLGGMVAEVKKAQAIASSLDSGDPHALQGLLDALVSEQGVTPGEASPGLFGMPMFTTPAPGQPDPMEEIAAQEGAAVPSGRTPTPAAPSYRVTMVINNARGGLAMIDGEALHAGQTVNGMTLMAVHEDGVTVREFGRDTFVPIR